MVNFVMRRAARIFCLICLVALGLTLAPHAPARAQDDLGDQISSERYIVIDAETGEVFAEKGAHDQVAIASLTKIFTTIEALERAPLATTITTDESDLFDASSTTMGFGPGETFTLQDLLYGMMLPSGNDAAHAIARALGEQPGDSPDEAVDRFVGYMNQRVRNMGLTETTLVNPHGLGVPGHFSSAHDVATFMMYALQYPTFVDVISTSQYDAAGYVVGNTNKLLGAYDGLIGGKTGYDDDSGYCLIEVASRNGSTMISVTLDGVAPDIWYQDNEVLLDYAFEQKAARESAGEPITGDVLSYLDPDAALIAQMVTPGASLGQVETEPQPTAAPQVAPEATAIIGEETEASGGANDDGTFGALVVVLLVAGAAVLIRLLGTGTRPKPRRSAKTTKDSEAPDGPEAG
jgi:D-alanyl-D-alanine carboxypeptidase